MQSSELINCLKTFTSINKNFVGVYSINTIPKFLKKNHFIIANTQPNTEAGQHWFCIIKTGLKTYEYFDSLGVTSEKIERLNFYKVFRPNCSVKFNETAFQTQNSSSCGLFVLYFIIQRLHNLDLSFLTVLEEIFKLDCQLNESIVKKFAEDHF